MRLLTTAFIVASSVAYGAVSAAFFLRANAPEPQQLPPAPEKSASQAAVKGPPPVISLSERWSPPVNPAPAARIVPDNFPPTPSQETTGAAPSSAVDSQARPTNSCNATACSRTYRSFDSATCTYQPHRGGSRSRQHCDR